MENVDKAFAIVLVSSLVATVLLLLAGFIAPAMFTGLVALITFSILAGGDGPDFGEG